MAHSVPKRGHGRTGRVTISHLVSVVPAKSQCQDLATQQCWPSFSHPTFLDLAEVPLEALRQDVGELEGELLLGSGVRWDVAPKLLQCSAEVFIIFRLSSIYPFLDVLFSMVAAARQHAPCLASFLAPVPLLS